MAPNTLTLQSISTWLQSGWKIFTQNRSAGIAYVLPLIVIGLIAEIILLTAGFGLVYFILAGGFLIIAPVLATLYYRIASTSREEEFTVNLKSNSLPVLAIGIITVILYLIWVTDALILYTIYFGLDPVYLNEYLTNTQIRTNVNTFVAYTFLMGMIIATIAYFITVSSIPLALYKRAGFVDAVAFSIKGIGKNFSVMVVWAFILGAIQLFTLIFIIPLSAVVFPVLSYANFAAFLDLSEKQS